MPGTLDTGLLYKDCLCQRSWCVCVCVSTTRELITNQVKSACNNRLTSSTAFHLPLIKCMSVTLVTHCIMNTRQEEKGDVVLATEVGISAIQHVL